MGKSWTRRQTTAEAAPPSNHKVSRLVKHEDFERHSLILQQHEMSRGSACTLWCNSYRTPCTSPIVAQSTTPRRAMSSTSKRTLRSCETAKACRTSDQGPTERVVALPWYQNNCTCLNRSTERAAIIRSCSSFQIKRKRQLLAAVEERGWGANAQERWVGCHRFTLEM